MRDQKEKTITPFIFFSSAPEKTIREVVETRALKPPAHVFDKRKDAAALIYCLKKLFSERPAVRALKCIEPENRPR
jgi:hypothetical protein